MTQNALPGFSSPSASTEVPLEMLAACHGRVEMQCRTLQRLTEHLLRHGCDEPARQAALAVMRYFDTAAQDHHADEEQDLFPALLAAASASAQDAGATQQLILSLLADHQRLAGLWLELRKTLASVAAGQTSRVYSAEVADFVNAYLGHLEREDSAMLPLAARLLSDADLARIGLAMRVRRGITTLD